MPIPVGVALGLGAMGLGASIFGSASAASAQRSAAALTNAEAKRQFDLNMAFQKYQYEDQKRYNSFENQVKMLRRSGINPSLQLGSGSGTVGTSSVGGVGSTAQATTPDYSWLPSSVKGLGSELLDAAVQQSAVGVNDSATQKNIADTQAQNIDNLYKDEFWKSSNYLRNSQAWLFDQQAENTKLQTLYDKESLGDRLFQTKWNAEQTRANTHAQLLTNAFIPEQLRANIDKTIAEQRLAVASGTASLKTAMAAVMRAVNEKHAFDAQYGGDPAQRGQFFNKVLQTMDEANESRKSEQYKNWLTPSVNVFGTAVRHPIGSFNAGSTAERSHAFRRTKK